MIGRLVDDGSRKNHDIHNSPIFTKVIARQHVTTDDADAGRRRRRHRTKHQPDRIQSALLLGLLYCIGYKNIIPGVSNNGP